MAFFAAGPFGPLLMKSSQSNFNLQSRGSYSACSYLIATVPIYSISLEPIAVNRGL